MQVTLVFCASDARRQRLARLFRSPELGEKLAVVEVTGDIIGVVLVKRLKMLEGGRRVACPGALHRQGVTRESVHGIFRDELFQGLAAAFCCLGHAEELRIIAVSFLEGQFHFEGGDAVRSAKAKQVARRDAPGTARGSNHRRDAEESAKLAGKPVDASRSEMVEAVLPNDANPLGYILGGRVMHLIDIAGAVAAHRHANSHVVTAAVDYLDFRSAIRIGDLIVLKSSVNRVFHTSMEVGVKVFSENTITGERRHTSSAYVTYVAIDENLHPHPVPPLFLKTAEDRRRWREAGERRKIRLAHRYKRAPRSE